MHNKTPIDQNEYKRQVMLAFADLNDLAGNNSQKKSIEILLRDKAQITQMLLDGGADIAEAQKYAEQRGFVFVQGQHSFSVASNVPAIVANSDLCILTRYDWEGVSKSAEFRETYPAYARAALTKLIVVDATTEHEACATIHAHLSQYTSDGWTVATALALVAGCRNQYFLQRNDERLAVEFDLRATMPFVGIKPPGLDGTANCIFFICASLLPALPGADRMIQNWKGNVQADKAEPVYNLISLVVIAAVIGGVLLLISRCSH